MKQYKPPTPAALYARVSSDRQDVDLSVSAQLRALKDYAKANGYSVAREYVDEAESGRDPVAVLQGSSPGNEESVQAHSAHCGNYETGEPGGSGG